MTDLDPDIAQQFRELANVNPDDNWARITTAPATVRRIPRRKPKRPIVLAAAACIVLGVGAVALSTRSRPATIRTVPSAVEPASTATPTTFLTSTSFSPARAPESTPVTIPPPPLAERVSAAVAATDRYVLVWGGHVSNDLDSSEPAFNDGAVFDRQTRGWTATAPAPLPGHYATAVAYNGRIAVANARQLALYDPVLNSWTTLSPPASVGVDLLLVVANNELVVLPVALAWNGTSWRRLTAPPPPDDNYGPDRFVGHGTDIFAWGAALPTGYLRVLRYAATTDSWQELPRSPLIPVHYGTGLAVVGRSLVVVEWLGMSAAVLNLDTLEWESLPTVPHPLVKTQIESAAIGESKAAFLFNDLAVIDLNTRTWTIHPGSRNMSLQAKLVPFGDDLLLGDTIIPPTFWK
jgi:hypothetical protein